MKKTLFFLLVLAMISGSAEPPHSITLESGNVRIRLDAKKRWNVNRIEWKNQLLGVDSPGAHYGIVYKPADGKYPIGTGHTESGIGEEVISLKIFADGKEVTPSEKQTVKGNKIRIEKISRIADFAARSSTVLENDILRETAEVSAEKDVKVDHIYFIMHPWSPRFDQFHAVFADGKKIDVTFKSDNSFPSRKFVPSSAWYETKTGLGAVTFIRNIEGRKSPMRFLWDRKNYRKDYLCDYYRSTFPAGKKVIYEAVTGFFRQPDAGKWTADAESMMENLSQIR